MVPNGVYTLEAVARDAAGNTRTSSAVHITVANSISPDATAPIISGVVIADVFTNAARISWSTNEPSDSQVDYGLTTNYGSSTTRDVRLVSSHVVTLANLTAAALYHVRVRSSDVAGNSSVSGDYTLTTFAVESRSPAATPVNPAPQPGTPSTPNTSVAPPVSAREGGTAVRLVRPANSSNVYAIKNVAGVERRQLVPSPGVFAANGYAWNEVKVIKPVELQRYGRVSLIRQTGDPKVYYVTESGLKRHIPTAVVFNSYGNRWEDVVEVSAVDVNAIPDSPLIRAVSDPKVYKLENGIKRWVVSAEAFNRSGFAWDKIAPVNQTELNAYSLGPDIR